MNKTFIPALILVALGTLGTSNANAHNSSLDESCPVEDENSIEFSDDQIKFRGNQDPESENHKGMNREELGTFHIGDIIKKFYGRNVRMRFWSMAPDGVIKLHLHDERPALVHILKGFVTERKFGVAEPKILKAGDTTVENKGTYHWWKNTSGKMVHLVAVDLCKGSKRQDGDPQDTDDLDLVKRKVVGAIDLDDEFPMGDKVKYLMRGHTIVIKNTGKTKIRSHGEKPTLTYVV